ncbi:hypothetical protein COLO4_05204 [Corchorus olitorius]|uniref:Uncharacterized protein n=1 Tax=Corchorus olitorius TaxID=93759 RepID=A0A1R3KRQ5_9ROSI|nr:hypothetical protein COLO4_05204 [Corchorus olitorius]
MEHWKMVTGKVTKLFEYEQEIWNATMSNPSAMDLSDSFKEDLANKVRMAAGMLKDIMEAVVPSAIVPPSKSKKKFVANKKVVGRGTRVLNKRIKRLCSRLRWPVHRRLKSKIVIKRFGKSNSKAHSEVKIIVFRMEFQKFIKMPNWMA